MAKNIKTFMMRFTIPDHALLVEAKAKMQLANPGERIGWADVMLNLSKEYLNK